MRQRGLTLVELVIVVVIMGITAAILLPVIANNMRAYGDTRARSDLTARGRIALERLAREVRHALPNSIRLLDSAGQPALGTTGQGIEFLRTRWGGRYVAHDDSRSGTWCSDIPGTAFQRVGRCFRAGEEMSEGEDEGRLYVLGSALSVLPNDYLVIGVTRADDLDPGADDAGPYVRLEAVEAAGPGDDEDGIAGNHILRFEKHTFPTGSPAQHYFVVDRAVRVGLVGDILRWAEDAGDTLIADYAANDAWTVSDPVLVDGVAAVEFTYSPATVKTPGIVGITLSLDENGQTMQLYEEVQVRNAM